MTETTTKPTVFEALAAVMAEVQAVGKGDHNKQQGYNFRGIDATINAVGPAFRKHGIIAVPHASEARYRDVQTSTGKPSRECTVRVTYRFYGPAGDFIDAEVPGESMDFGDKGAPKAMSVAYRIALLQALCIPTDEPEPDSYSYERSAPPPPPQAETDWAWASAFENKVNASSSQQELSERWTELVGAFKDGKVTETDGNHLKALIAERKDELTIPRNMDGSTSRSRATDEQLTANGEMTKGEKADHNRMVKDTMANPHLAERVTAPVPDDPWANSGTYGATDG
jgi:hypothetical protein